MTCHIRGYFCGRAEHDLCSGRTPCPVEGCRGQRGGPTTGEEGQR